MFQVECASRVKYASSTHQPFHAEATIKDYDRPMQFIHGTRQTTETSPIHKKQRISLLVC